MIERFLCEHPGFIDLHLGGIRSSEADGDKAVAFQDIENAAEPIAYPKSFVADAFDFFGRNRPSFFSPSSSLGVFFIFPVKSECLLPISSRIASMLFGCLVLCRCHAHGFAKLCRGIETL